jgi:EAL domain-containing protein (putative c-di-GMP-specific phosphodiesterase class I)/AmiR/NasT family two-component response regulator
MPLRNVLVIDDDPLFCVIAEETLLALGAGQVMVAGDGAEGLQMVADRPEAFDLILCDLNMPNIDGVLVLRELGSRNYSGALIIVSSEKQAVIESVYAMARLAGVRMLGALKKPLNANALKQLPLSEVSAQSGQISAVSRDELRAALDTEAIVPVYQPKLDLQNGEIRSVEVLARYAQPGSGLKSAYAYLLAGESHGMMLELTLSQIEQVAFQARSWRDAGLDLDFAFNISPSLLQDNHLPEHLMAAVEKGELSPHMITLEITEDQLIHYSADVLEVLSRLRIKGFHLSIDDFGTGATSFEQLRRYPFSEMKIDMTFVQDVLTDSFARLTVATSLKLANFLNMSVVAEGVETEAQLDYFRKAGAAFVQGYLIAKPLAGDDVIPWMRKNHGRWTSPLPDQPDADAKSA